MEQKASLGSRIQQAEVERQYLYYYNKVLFTQGLITEKEYISMQMAIASRRNPGTRQR